MSGRSKALKADPTAAIGPKIIMPIMSIIEGITAGMYSGPSKNTIISFAKNMIKSPNIERNIKTYLIILLISRLLAENILLAW